MQYWRALVWARASVRKCVLHHKCAFDLHIFHADPLVIGENGPYRHCLDTLLLLWGGKDGGNSTSKISCLFPLYSMCNVHCDSDVMSSSHGAKYSLLNLQWYPKVLSEQNQTNTCKHIHTHTDSNRQRTQIPGGPFLSLDRSPVGMFTLWSYQGLYGPAHIPWRFPYMCVT